MTPNIPEINPDSTSSPQTRIATLNSILLDTVDLLENCLVYGDEESSYSAQLQVDAIRTLLMPEIAVVEAA